MTRNRILILSAALGALVVLLASTWFFAMQSEARKQKDDHLKGREPLEIASNVNLPLPAYRIANLEQQEIPADELRRGRVLLVYLTTSCEPCLKEVEIISRLHRDAPPDLRIYGISFERPAQVATFVKEFDLKFPMLIDMSSQLARSLEVHYFPSKYLVEEGVITTIWPGLTRDEAHLRQQLKIK
jgi:peroxiredoxin